MKPDSKPTQANQNRSKTSLQANKDLWLSDVLRQELDRVHLMTEPASSRTRKGTTLGRTRMEWSNPERFTQEMFTACWNCARSPEAERFFSTEVIRLEFAQLLRGLGRTDLDELFRRLHPGWNQLQQVQRVNEPLAQNAFERSIPFEKRQEWPVVGSPWAKKTYLFQYTLVAFWSCIPLYRIILEDKLGTGSQAEKVTLAPQTLFEQSSHLMIIKPYLAYMRATFERLVGAEISERQIIDYCTLFKGINDLARLEILPKKYLDSFLPVSMAPYPWEHPRVMLDLLLIDRSDGSITGTQTVYRDRSGLLLCIDLATEGFHRYLKTENNAHVMSEFNSKSGEETKEIFDLWWKQGYGRAKLIEEIETKRGHQEQTITPHDALRERRLQFDAIVKEELELFDQVVGELTRLGRFPRLLSCQHYNSQSKEFSQHLPPDEQNFKEALAVYEGIDVGFGGPPDIKVIHYVYYHGFKNLAAEVEKHSRKCIQDIDTLDFKNLESNLLKDLLRHINKPDVADLLVVFVRAKLSPSIIEDLQVYPLHHLLAGSPPSRSGQMSLLTMDEARESYPSALLESIDDRLYKTPLRPRSGIQALLNQIKGS